MKRHRLIVIEVSAAACIWSGCARSVSPDNVQSSIVQVPGCMSAQPGKASASSDSCLTYLFQNTLFIDFCATGNCCPDSNRFEIKHEIRGDTIAVTIADTTVALCRCMCKYILHAEFYDLPRDQYVFLCKRADASSSILMYSATVYKHE
jgi:hypothetical protein